MSHGQASVDAIKKEIDASLAATQQELAAAKTGDGFNPPCRWVVWC